MTDDAELAGLNPFDILDREAARIDGYLSGLPETDWSRPSRCADWSIRDVLAHLADAEHYHRACLDGEVQAFLEAQSARGANDIASANALGIAARADRTPEQVLTEWREANAETRRRFREQGEGVIDTSVGDYPCRWQAFHVAGELATHADDVFVPVAAEEGDERRAWRARFSRFALAEEKPDLVIHVEAGRTRVRARGIDVAVDDAELVEAVAGRLEESSRLDPVARVLLSTMP
jgi:uncharacterized protein (TIGR03083 family)